MEPRLEPRRPKKTSSIDECIEKMKQEIDAVNHKKAKINVDLSITPFDCLADEVTLKIFSYLSVKELLLVALTNRKFSQLCLDDQLWKPFLLEIDPGVENTRNSKRLYFSLFKLSQTEEYGDIIAALLRWRCDYYLDVSSEYMVNELFSQYNLSMRKIMQNRIDDSCFTMYGSDKETSPEASADEGEDNLELETHHSQVAPVIPQKQINSRIICSRLITLDDINTLGRLKQTFLHAFASIGDLGALQLLINAGGDVNQSDMGSNTPLTCLVRYYYENGCHQNEDQRFYDFINAFCSTNMMGITLDQILHNCLSTDIDFPNENSLKVIYLLIGHGLATGAITQEEVTEDFASWYENNRGNSFDLAPINNFKQCFDESCQRIFASIV